MKNRTKKIFVGGVPTDMPEETIKNYFVQFGEVRGKLDIEAFLPHALPLWFALELSFRLVKRYYGRL